MKIILIINCFIDGGLAESLDARIMGIASSAGFSCESFHAAGTAARPGPGGYSHVIISGSEASARENNLWDRTLEGIIRDSLEAGRALLGICYGHQFLAKTLSGKECVRRMEQPELGWIKIRMGVGASPGNVSAPAIFQGIENPVCMVSHYDEVFELSDDFQVIAASDRCPIHGYRYRDLPVWGVQFHPEYDLAGANEVFRVLEKNDPDFGKHYDSGQAEGHNIAQNGRIITNFLGFQG